MAKKGFNRNHKAIGDILKHDPGLIAALEAEAESLRKEAGGWVTQYETDRAVFGVYVRAEDQAIRGSLTKAVGKRGKTLK